MTEILTQIPVEFDVPALMRLVHAEPDSDDAVTFGRLVDLALETAKPKVLYAEAFVQDRGEKTVRIEGITFTSRMLRLNLDRIERVFAYVATCGHEMDQVALPPDEFLAEFWWDTIKAAVLNCAIRHFHEHLERHFRLGKTAQMNPGSGDAEVWPIQQQQELFALLGDVTGRIGVELTDTCLMIPNKSVSGVVFRAESDFRSCQVCKREHCPSRGAPFDQDLWDAIHRCI